MDYGQGEVNISQYLNSKFAELNLSEKFVVAPMPETEKEMKDFEKLIDKTRCAVEYLESDFENPSALGCVRQGESVKFRLLFDGRKFRGEDGIFKMQYLVKQFLIGYKLPNGERMSISGSGKLQYDPGVWLRFIDFESKTVNIQSIEENEAIGGPFQKPLTIL